MTIKTTFSVTQFGKELVTSLYSWNEATKTFYSNEDNLVLDFNNIDNVTFKTGSNCTFKTRYNCTFNTGSYCTFDTGFDCTFKTGSDCVVVRRGIFEVIVLNEDNNHIKLNGYSIKGYEHIKPTRTITINGKEIELSEESFNNLKTQLRD